MFTPLTGLCEQSSFDVAKLGSHLSETYDHNGSGPTNRSGFCFTSAVGGADSPTPMSESKTQSGNVSVNEVAGFGLLASCADSATFVQRIVTGDRSV